MRILVFGAGAIGSAFGGFLSTRHDVTLLGRAWHLERIKKRGLRVEGIWGRHTFHEFTLETNAAKLFTRRLPFNLILITVKSNDTESAARFLSNRLSPGTLVLSLQNGVGNVETLHRFLPPEQVLAGRVIFGVEIKPGKIRITVSADKTRLGETTAKKVTERVKNLARLFNKAGLPCEAVPDIEKFLWTKLAYNTALNPLASVLNLHYGALAEHDSTRFLMEEMIREVYRVAQKKKINMEPRAADGFIRVFYNKLVPRTYDHHPSMLRDLFRGRRTEIDALNGAVAALGRKLRVPAPYNELVTELIHSREKR